MNSTYHSHNDPLQFQWHVDYEDLVPLTSFILPFCPLSTDPSLGCYWEAGTEGDQRVARFVEFKPHGGVPA